MASLIPRLGYLAVCLGLALSRIGAGFAPLSAIGASCGIGGKIRLTLVSQNP